MTVYTYRVSYEGRLPVFMGQPTIRGDSPLKALRREYPEFEFAKATDSDSPELVIRVDRIFDVPKVRGFMNHRYSFKPVDLESPLWARIAEVQS